MTVRIIVADVGATFLSVDLNLDTVPREDHAANLGHWLKVLKTDGRAIFAAASHAQRVCDVLHGLQPQSPE
jgi:antirestriction protein ArdC